MGLDSGGKHGVRDMIKTQNLVNFTLIYIDAQFETVSVVCRYALLTWCWLKLMQTVWLPVELFENFLSENIVNWE